MSEFPGLCCSQPASRSLGRGGRYPMSRLGKRTNIWRFVSVGCSALQPISYPPHNPIHPKDTRGDRKEWAESNRVTLWKFQITGFSIIIIYSMPPTHQNVRQSCYWPWMGESEWVSRRWVCTDFRNNFQTNRILEFYYIQCSNNRPQPILI